jgi:hypothetical protein
MVAFVLVQTKTLRGSEELSKRACSEVFLLFLLDCRFCHPRTVYYGRCLIFFCAHKASSPFGHNKIQDRQKQNTVWSYIHFRTLWLVKKVAKMTMTESFFDSISIPGSERFFSIVPFRKKVWLWQKCCNIEVPGSKSTPTKKYSKIKRPLHQGPTSSSKREPGLFWKLPRV